MSRILLGRKATRGFIVRNNLESPRRLPAAKTKEVLRHWAHFDLKALCLGRRRVARVTPDIPTEPLVPLMRG